MAAEVDDNSVAPLDATGNRPLVVRIKRKALHSPVEAFWLEISERPCKRPLIDFEKLSISASSGKEDLKSRRVFVKHVDTVSSSKATVEALKTCVKPCHDDAFRSRGNDGSHRQFAKDNKQCLLLSKATHEQETLAKSARFKQIWRKRMRNKEGSIDETLHQLCHLYDVVRVDLEETHQKEKQLEKMSKEDEEYLAKFLPLLREHIPDAAEQIESDISSSSTAGQDGYVYDLYTVGEESMEDSDHTRPYPLIQVDDNDDDVWYDGPDDSDCESYDSNAENHPLNDYPDEVSDDDDEDEEEKSSNASSDGDESEEGETDTNSEKSSSAEDHKKCEHDLTEDDEMYHGYRDDDDLSDGDDGGWRQDCY